MGRRILTGSRVSDESVPETAADYFRNAPRELMLLRRGGYCHACLLVTVHNLRSYVRSRLKIECTDADPDRDRVKLYSEAVAVRLAVFATVARLQPVMSWMKLQERPSFSRLAIPSLSSVSLVTALSLGLCLALRLPAATTVVILASHCREHVQAACR
jgi:hypothetical protein